MEGEESGVSPREHTPLAYWCSSSCGPAMLSYAKVALLATGEREEAPESDAGEDARIHMGRGDFVLCNGLP